MAAMSDSTDLQWSLVRGNTEQTENIQEEAEGKSLIPHPQLWKCVWSKRWRLQLLEEAALSLIENETEIMFHVSCQVMVLKP